jgi:hypothetical protein
MLPFGVGYQSDHQALFIKVDLSSILQTSVQPIDSITARKLTQATPKERAIFLESTNNYFTNQNLYQRLKKLTTIKATEWKATHTEEFEKCDKTMVDGMLAAELSTKKINTTSWSPKFAKAVSKKMFWKIALLLKTNHRRASPEYLEWSLKLGIINFQLLDIVTVKHEYRAAQRELKEVERQAEQLREEHLRSLLTNAELNGDDAKVE